MVEDMAYEKRVTRYSKHILTDNFRESTNPDVITIVHKALMWYLRVFYDDIERSDTEDHLKELQRLNEQAGTLPVLIETHRELAGYRGRDPRTIEQAFAEIDKLNKLTTSGVPLPTYGSPTLLRPKIETLR